MNVREMINQLEKMGFKVKAHKRADGGWIIRKINDMTFTGASALKVSSPTLVVAQSLRCVRLFCDPMDCSPQAPLSLGFPRQEYWSGLPFPSPGDLPS